MNFDRILADFAITLAVTRHTLRTWRNLINLSIVGNVITQYRDALGNFVYDALNGRLSAVDFRKAHKVLIRSLAPDAFIAGLRDGGAVDEDIVSFVDDNRSMLADWITNQVSHVDGFAADVVDVQGDQDKRAAILDRLDRWSEALRGLAEQAAVIAKGDPVLVLSGDDGTESCYECRYWKGKPHRRSFWEKRGLLERFGNPHYTCGRWDNCHHSFYYADGSLAIA